MLKTPKRFGHGLTVPGLQEKNLPVKVKNQKVDLEPEGRQDGTETPLSEQSAMQSTRTLGCTPPRNAGAVTLTNGIFQRT